ncbi:hypothetical protein Tco_1068218 [Tanacetum coccineum]|uniref:Uncharacterized protein n=1 Tax=Tanacetum coccineum TaxID=301880 RepID=A0ABQ5HGJ5_9ASTR
MLLQVGMSLKRKNVYSTKRILAVTHVSVMRKHGYGYLEEIIVRRADNALYRFKEGDFPTDFKSDIDEIIHYQEYRHGILAKEKMEHIGKEKSSFHDQGHQQAAKGKENDKEFGEIRVWEELYGTEPQTLQRTILNRQIVIITQRFDTPTGNPVKNILLKLNLYDHRSILTDSKEYLKMVMERQSVKVKEIQERCIIKAFQDYQIKKGMSMSVQKSQVHEMTKFTRWRNKIIPG